ncbi:glycosyltransferase [Pseudomonas sp. TE50-2]|uniref:glycosyltransferase n=1 Tax=Pseudomonas sp. TE50-2 TaxID=3142707 RepID=UPI003466315F
MSQPEWDDQDLDFRNFPNENNFFESLTPVALTRPDWYFRVDIRHYQDRRIKLLSRFAPRVLKELLRPYYYRLFHRQEFSLSSVSEKACLASVVDGVHADDVAKFVPNINWIKGLVADEDVIFAYVISPIYTMFAHDRPVVAVEIGTMRELPFEKSSNGRLLSAAYKTVDHVVITNPDVRVQAEKLGVKSFSFCPHPVDEDRYKPAKDSAVRNTWCDAIPDTEWVGIAPARQNWEIKGNQKYLEALKELREVHGRKVSLVIPAWGQDVENSRRYAQKLGVDRYIKWIPPVSETTLISMFGSLDFVLDQFELGVFGLITPKALSCGGMVITSYSPEVHEWCFSEPPPLFPADSAESVCEQILFLTSGRATEALRHASREWFMRNHSKQVVRRQLDFAAAQAIKNFEAKNEKTTFG